MKTGAGQARRITLPKQAAGRYCCKAALVLFYFSSAAQVVTPANHTRLFQTQVMFSVPPVMNALSYRFIIYEPGLITREEKCPATLVSGLQFNSSYTWKAEAKTGDSTYTFGPYTFSTAALTDSPQVRFSTFAGHDHPDQYQDGLIMLDYTNVAINRKGEIVWFLNPDAPHIRRHRRLLRPLQLSDKGNILFTSGNGAMECSLTGGLLWRSPDKVPQLPDSPLLYHHDIQKLHDGSYLTVVRYQQKLLFPDIDKDSLLIDNDALVIIDGQNRVKWIWKAGEKLDMDHKNLYCRKKRKGNEKYLAIAEINSVYLDEQNKRMYVGIKDLNTLLVLDYPSGRITRSYGDPFPGSPLNFARGAFTYQHGGIPSPHGLLVFNNNGENRDSALTELVMLNENGSDTLQNMVKWKFTCLIDSLSPAKTNRLGFASPLSNGNVLVCMGYAARLFELNSRQELVWDCLPEAKAAGTSTWKTIPNYRAYFYPSLYPNFFVVQPGMYKEGRTVSIYNKGYSDDTYGIYLADEEGRGKLVKRIRVGANSSNTFQLPGRKGAVEIKSVNTGEKKIVNY